jgi:hypothetical protein
MSQEKDKRDENPVMEAQETETQMTTGAEAEHLNERSTAQKIKLEPVLVWERNKRKPEKATVEKIIDLHMYRQLLESNESEATVTSWELTREQSEQPVELIMISSGFGKHVKGSNYVQCLAA